jgi:hypothetical protein
MTLQIVLETMTGKKLDVLVGVSTSELGMYDIFTIWEILKAQDSHYILEWPLKNFKSMFLARLSSIVLTCSCNSPR